MTWIKFTLWLLGCYTAYYVALILWDFLRSGKSFKSDLPDELTFADEPELVRVVHDEVENYPGSAIISSGGVLLKDLFSLAREEAVEFTRPVSF